MRLARSFPVVGLFVLSGCLEHNIQTTVSEDGSCERVIMVPADSVSIPETPFPLHVDAAWDTAWRPAKGGKGLVLVLSRRFASFDELAAAYGPPVDSSRLHVEVAVERSFRWFYTYYHYREVFHRLTPFTDVPPSSVLTDEEIARYTQGERTGLLDQKAEIWVARNLYEILFRTMRSGLASSGDVVAVGTLDRGKEELFQSMVQPGPDSTLRDFGEVIAERTTFRGKKGTLFVGSRITDDGLAAFVELVGSVVGLPPTPALEGSARAAWTAWNAAVERSARMQGIFVNSVRLPGLVVRTNSPITEEHVLTWKFDGEQYSMTDYVMDAESRVENLWAFGVTVTVALVLGGIVLYGRRASPSPSPNRNHQ